MGKIELNGLDNKIYVDEIEKLDLGTFDQRNSLLFKGNLGASEDLNSYTVPGIYHQAYNINALSGTNYPEPYAGELQVTAGDGMVYQSYHVYKEYEKIFYRAKYTTSWTPWSQVATKTYVDNSISNIPVIADASTTVSGKIRLATSAEATTGTDATKAITPATLKTVADTKAALVATSSSYGGVKVLLSGTTLYMTV